MGFMQWIRILGDLRQRVLRDIREADPQTLSSVTLTLGPSPSLVYLQDLTLHAEWGPRLLVEAAEIVQKVVPERTYSESAVGFSISKVHYVNEIPLAQASSAHRVSSVGDYQVTGSLIDLKTFEILPELNAASVSTLSWIHAQRARWWPGDTGGVPDLIRRMAGGLRNLDGPTTPPARVEVGHLVFTLGHGQVDPGTKMRGDSL
ncbi:MAG: hypothetical protein ACOY93_19220 [Bacillota bacterium]